MRNECHGGETGRRAGFKIQLGQLSAGSIPARGTKALFQNILEHIKPLIVKGFFIACYLL